jgi:hypothetical protein
MRGVHKILLEFLAAEGEKEMSRFCSAKGRRKILKHKVNKKFNITFIVRLFRFLKDQLYRYRKGEIIIIKATQTNEATEEWLHSFFTSTQD